ncbi:MAG: DUF1553 domain-containing protein [Planctomycetota bacterium]|nr:MAG: DUF1553 domain-containing protein [Planctomycetota bacterium]
MLILACVPRIVGALAACLGIGVSHVFFQEPEAERVSFDDQIRPILAAKCFACHGPDQAARKAGLRLDLREDFLSVAEPGDVESSEFFLRITEPNPEDLMPPPEVGDPLSQEEISLLRQWIQEGLPWADHWAFVVPETPPIPAVGDSSWPRNPIDAFVLAKLEAKGERPSPQASKAKLLRRLSFDLTGLPPTLEELDAFLNDGEEDAYEKAVDRLLASPRYGEHMARWWLDGARYADTNGYQNDFARQMWPWRDWVIAALNQNMPFDQFTVEQLAGDLLPEATLEQRIATGFNRNHRTVTEVGSIAEEWRVENVVDRVETTASVFLGLTMGCARCHDHKYDPISQTEFYRFYAFFNSIAEEGVYAEARGNVAPLLQVPRAMDEAKLYDLDTRRLAAEVELKRLEEEVASHLPLWEAELLKAPKVFFPPAKLRVVSAPIQGEAGPNRSEAPHLSLAGKEGSFADLGQALSVESNSPFSVSCWILAEKDGAVYAKMSDDDAYRGIDLLISPERKVVAHWIHDWPENALKVESKQTIPFGRWIHFVMTYDGSMKATGLHLYVDGSELSFDVRKDHLQGSIHTLSPLRLGRRHYAPYFGGAIADLRFFDYELSDGQRGTLRRARLLELLHLAGKDSENPLQAELDQLLIGVFAADVASTRREIAALEDQKKAVLRAVPTTMVMQELPQPRSTFYLKRGRYDAPIGDPLSAGLPEFLPGLPAKENLNRLDLAEWIVSENNPLTSRVIVNQLWQRLFGHGIVETSENFGIQGARPTHPALLNWLATEWVRLGWDLKAIQKTMVMSATYQQSSNADPQAFERDPQNQQLSRGPRFRLSAEELRDQALAVSGLLVEKLGGPPTRPYQPDGMWKELAGGAGQGPYVQDRGEGLYRRSLYTHRKRTVPHPTLAIFDAPSFEICQLRRSRTNTPLQALALLNDVTFVEASRKLAERMILKGGSTAAERLRFGFRLVTGRHPDEAELETMIAGLERRRAGFAREPERADQLLALGESAHDPQLEKVELAAYALSAAVLFNLDECLTKE